jgi:hypothetical protein
VTSLIAISISIQSYLFQHLTRRAATCKVCGLTARNKEELEDHIKRAHEERST